MEMLLREASEGQPLWRVETTFDSHGLFLASGWASFAREYDLHEGHILKFRYGGCRKLSVRIFDGTLCRRHFPSWDSSDDEA